MRVIAIDGPAGAGKSTVAKALARRLGLEYLDTGAMYRGVAFAALRRGIDPSEDISIARVANDVELDVSEKGVLVDGVDASIEIRGQVTCRERRRPTPACGQDASVSAHGQSRGAAASSKVATSGRSSSRRQLMYLTADPSARAAPQGGRRLAVRRSRRRSPSVMPRRGSGPRAARRS
jgi:hypothetical protein